MSFISNILSTLSYSIDVTKAILKSERRYPRKQRYGGTLTLLSNAPSLKEVLPRVLTEEEFKNTDFIVLNYFATCDEFAKIKPQHYCFADPMFFKKTHRHEEVMNLFRLMEKKVDWDMNIYVPSHYYNRFKNYSGFVDNSYLHIIPVWEKQFKGFEYFRFWTYKYNFAAPINQTVAILAILVGLNSGYQKINLYGVDMTFFDNLVINENNQLCSIYRHFNDQAEELKPILDNSTGEVMAISDYILCIGQMFKSHDLLSRYAKYLGVEIINCTNCSLIDSYKRKQ